MQCFARLAWQTYVKSGPKSTGSFNTKDHAKMTANLEYVGKVSNRK